MQKCIKCKKEFKPNTEYYNYHLFVDDYKACLHDFCDDCTKEILDDKKVILAWV